VLDSSSDELLSPDSSDQDNATAALPKRVQRRKPQFNSAAVLKAVLGSAKTSHSAEVTGVKQHVPAFFGRDTEDRWETWYQRTPNHLSEVPAERSNAAKCPDDASPPTRQWSRCHAFRER
jgi:hypothetical protein